MGIEFRSTSGLAVDELIVELKGRLTVTSADMQLAGEIVRSGIRERTARGVDADGTPFAPYSTKGPYYYNPSTAGGKFKPTSEEHAKRAAKRLHGILRGRGLPGELSKSGTTIRFDSYAAFKAAFGRVVVDLFGVDAPHMLEEIVVDVTAADTVVIKIDGEARGRALGHNFGGGRNKLRHFFAIAESDARAIVEYFQRRLRSRTGA